jgi:hypothetical protein
MSGVISGVTINAPLWNGSVRNFNPNPHTQGATPPPSTQEGDTFTPTVTPTVQQKPAFPILATVISGATTGALGFSWASDSAPKKTPSQLIPIAGKDVTIEGNVVKHNGYDYTMQQDKNGRYSLGFQPTVRVGDTPYTAFSTSNGNLYFSYPQHYTANEPKLPQEVVKGLGLQEGQLFLLRVETNQVLMETVDSKTRKSILSPIVFDIVKDADGNPALAVSKQLQTQLSSFKRTDVTQEAMEAIANGSFAKAFHVFEASEKLPNLQPPEAIETLIHGLGRSRRWIIASGLGCLAIGAGIGYLLGKQEDPPLLVPISLQ